MIPYNPIDGNFRARRFKEIFSNTEDFTAEFKASDLSKINNSYVLTDDAISITYALLYARYGNSTIAMFDENQFKYNVYSIMFMYGPTWAKRLITQDELRKLDIDELRTGSKVISNDALNPSSSPTTASLEELSYINQQNVTSYKKSKIEAYGMLLTYLDTDVTEEYIGKFKKLFITIVQPDYPLWYKTTAEEQNLIDEE